MLIVDDERLLLDGLYQLFTEHEGHRLSIHKASNAMEALQVFNYRKIDLLMTDIKMPKMSGLELSDKVRQSWPECKIIFLTGYDEFDYAHHAIRSGAQNYVLKLEGDNQILNAVRQTIAELDNDRATSSLLQNAKALQHKQLAHQRSLFLTELVEGRLPAEEPTNETFRSLEIDMMASKPVFVAVGRLDSSTETMKMTERERLFHKLHACCDPYLSPYVNYADVACSRDYFVLLIQPFDKLFLSPERMCAFMRGALESMQRVVAKTMEQSLSFALSDRFIAWDQAHQQYTMLKVLLSRFRPENRIIVAQSGEPTGKDAAPDTEVRRLVDLYHKKVNLLDMYLEMGRKEEVGHMLDELRSYSNRHDINDKRYLEMYHATVLRYLKVVNKYGLDREVPVHDRLAGMLQSSPSDTREAGVELLESAASLLYDYHKVNSLKLNGDVVHKVKAYIENNLSRDLSLTALSEMVHLNPDYLSKLFKQAEGMTIIEYISFLKTQKAKELLAKRHLRVQDIAKSLGFSTAGYFSRFFKKETGKTPQQFRTG